MKQKELRLALVCFGGVSLAVYMHGVCKEVLKLARASRAYHAEADPERRRARVYGESVEPSGDRPDSEAVYFELLREVGRRLDLRVLVDIVAGASAGGINGIFLARALAHDLAFDPLRDLWLKNSDVGELIAPERRAKAWTKYVVDPLMFGVARQRIERLTPDPETREKLSLLVRSRWFRPPFGGAVMTDFLLQGMRAMANVAQRDNSLLPAGHRLNLFVTATDFHGHDQPIALHDPPLVNEREHRHLFRFRYRRSLGGTVHSEFDDNWLPGLVFAARATSSFPGAFPPAQLSEVAEVLSRNGLDWPAREAFLRRNFQTHRARGLDPMAVSFIDGSVLNNKPFAEAIAAIERRPAFRQVDRRLVFIDPHPEENRPANPGRAPGFFLTLRGALSDIPRAEPVRDELERIAEHNKRVRRLVSIFEAERPTIAKLVRKVAGDDFTDRPEPGQITGWRALNRWWAVERTGFTYAGYARLRAGSVQTSLAELALDTFGQLENLPVRTKVEARLEHWASHRGAYSQVGTPEAGRNGEEAELPRWAAFLTAFDAQFRTRRVRFVIRQLNELYGPADAHEDSAAIAAQLDAVKTDFYGVLELLRIRQTPEVMSHELAARLASLLTGEHGLDLAALDGAMTALESSLDLTGLDDAVDRLFVTDRFRSLPAEAREALIVAYVGFAFWDVLTLAIMESHQGAEFDEIRVDRISPDDARTLDAGGARNILKGIGMGHFAAFFSRQHRENDYLWGRLHAAERLIDIVVDSAAMDNATQNVDIRMIKKQMFAAIIDAEAEQLGQSGPLLDELRKRIARM